MSGRYTKLTPQQKARADSRWVRYTTCLVVIALALGIVGVVLGAISFHRTHEEEKEEKDLNPWVPEKIQEKDFYKPGLQPKADWAVWGQDITNDHFNDRSGLGPGDGKNLKERCANVFEGTVGTSGTPTIVDNWVYYTNYEGYVTAFDLNNCETLWTRSVANVLGLDALTNVIISRNSPTLFVNELGREGILIGAPGDRTGGMFNGTEGNLVLPCLVMALDRFTGETIWVTEVGTNEGDDYLCLTTASLSVWKNNGYGGLSSINNVVLGNNATNETCTFRGSFYSLELNYGTLLHKTFTVPGNFCGGGVWGSGMPVHDGVIFYGTGQLYMYNQTIADCMATAYDPSITPFLCLPPNVMIDAIVALDAETMEVVWYHTVMGVDAWGLACVGFAPQNTSGCPPFPGPDFDFGQAPDLITIDDEKYVVAENKGGILVCLSAETGNVRFSLNLGPGSTLGGGHWGISVDPDEKIIVGFISGNAASNYFGNETLPFSYQLGDGSLVCNGGFWVGVDAVSGHVIWQTPEAYAGRGSACPLPAPASDTSEIFKANIIFTDTAGHLQPPVSSTPQWKGVGESCEPLDIYPPPLPVQGELATIQGPPASSKGGLTLGGSMSGNVNVLRTRNGNCEKLLHCKPQGSIYGGVALSNDNEVVFGCGYGRLTPLWEEFAGGNRVEVYHLKDNDSDDDDDE